MYTSLMAATWSTKGPWERLAAMAAPGGWIYRDAHYLVAEVEIDPRAARRWVPRPLTPVSPATASVFTAYFPHTSFGSVYREAGVLLHVEHRGERAVFCPWMIVDDDVAMILGRELLGYPKKMGDITFTHDGDAIEGVAARRGTELLRMRGTLGDAVTGAPPILGRPHRNVRASLGLALPWLLAFTPREEAIEVRRVALDLLVGGSERDPLDELGCGPVRAAYLHRVNLGAGTIPRPIRVASPLHQVNSLLLRVH